MEETSSAEDRALRDLAMRDLLGDLESAFRGEERAELGRRAGTESDAVWTASRMCAGISIVMDMTAVLRQVLREQLLGRMHSPRIYDAVSSRTADSGGPGVQSECFVAAQKEGNWKERESFVGAIRWRCLSKAAWARR